MDAVHAVAHLLQVTSKSIWSSVSGHRGGRPGTVTVIRRFGVALNLRLHFHTRMFGGAFVREHGGSFSLRPCQSVRDEEVKLLFCLIQGRILRLRALSLAVRGARGRLRTRKPALAP